MDRRLQLQFSKCAQRLGDRTRRINELLDRHSEKKSGACLLQAGEIACRALKEVASEKRLDEMLRYLEEQARENSEGVRELVLDAAKFEEFLAAETLILVTLGMPLQTANLLIDECRRRGERAATPPNPGQLRQALDVLCDEVCAGSELYRAKLDRTRLVRRIGGWGMMLGNGALGAAAMAGAPFTFGTSIAAAAGAAASAGFGGHLATSDE